MIASLREIFCFEVVFKPIYIKRVVKIILINYPKYLLGIDFRHG